jgi:cytolysin (calcineurin-like family phosphatase)
MNEDQTAVEWLNNQLKDNIEYVTHQDRVFYEHIISQALKYEEEQTDRARVSGYDFAKKFNK